MDQGRALPSSGLPRITERPARECGDECSGLARRAEPQSHGRKSVVRGLPGMARQEIKTHKLGDPLDFNLIGSIPRSLLRNG